MDFEEFLWAKGDRVTMMAIQDAYMKRKALGDGIHRKIMQIFRTYMVVGGMPQAINAFIEGKSYKEIDFVKRNILSLYEADLKKYDEDNREKASVIFKTIPEQLKNHNSHFKFSMVDKNARYKNYIDAVNFVSESMMGNECIHVTTPEKSMEVYADRSNFKLYMGDTGILITQIMKNSDETTDDLYKAIIFDRLGINQGMIVENIVAQMLRAKGYDLFFHEFLAKDDDTSKEKKYEIDFLIVKKRKVCPIEVKSSAYKRHKSFDLFARKYPVKLEDRFVLYTKDLQYENGILYMPIYMTICL